MGLIQSIHRLLQLLVGKEQLYIDAASVWYPVATKVLQGMPLYITPAVDNKPPLFQFINILIAASGEYLILFTTVIGVANGCVAILTFQLTREYSSLWTGFVAGVFFLSSLPVIGGRWINVRSIALVAILLSMKTSNPRQSGISLGCAGMITQYSALAILGVVYFQVKRRSSGLEWIKSFAVSGILLSISMYLLVGLLFQYQSLLNAIDYTIFSVTSYPTNGPAVKHSVFGSPMLSAGDIMRVIIHLPHIFLPLVFHRLINKNTDEFHVFMTMVMILSVTLLIPLGIRTIRYYWILPMPFLCIIAAVTLVQVIQIHDITQ